MSNLTSTTHWPQFHEYHANGMMPYSHAVLKYILIADAACARRLWSVDLPVAQARPGANSHMVKGINYLVIS